MKLIVFNEKSILNNAIVRGINYFVLFILLLCGIGNASRFKTGWWICVIVPIISSIISSCILNAILKSTEFFEWDYTERKKKMRFTIKCSFLCGLLSSLFVFSITMAYIVISSSDLMLIGQVLFIVPILYFAFNLMNIVSLYYPLFEEDLTMGYKLQKKPKNWQDNGEEIKNEDEIREIMHRDFGIDI